jgi:hypothetical protein
MPVTFEGGWLLEIASKDADFGQRFIVSGSDASDGAYPGEVGTPPVTVTGLNWTVDFEWNDNAGSGWQPSAVRKTGAECTLDIGLVIILGVDDNRPEFRDNDFNDVVLRCRCVEPALIPWVPFVNPYDFSIKPQPDPQGPDDRIIGDTIIGDTINGDTVTPSRPRPRLVPRGPN